MHLSGDIMPRCPLLKTRSYSVTHVGAEERVESSEKMTYVGSKVMAKK